MVDYKKYKVWQRSHQMALDVYKLTDSFPKSEQSGLISQMNRVAISIPTNIAEGCGRQTQKELVRFLHISSGSAHELDCLQLVSRERGFIEPKTANRFEKEIDGIKKSLAVLIKTIKKLF